MGAVGRSARGPVASDEASVEKTNIIALLTDFGRRDGYVAALKGRVLGLHAAAQFIDITHEISAQGVEHGAQVLADVRPYLPVGCVCMAVVDPGVGTARRGIVVECGDRRHRFVGPDNGLLWPAVHGDLLAAHVIENTSFFAASVAPTFHGRDVFAPVAAHLALGVPIERFGSKVEGIERYQIPDVVRQDTGLCGQILRADHFGNLITNIDGHSLPDPNVPSRMRVEVCGHVIHGLTSCYGLAAPGQLIATIGGFGWLEIAVVGGSAEKVLRYTSLESCPVSVSW